MESLLKLSNQFVKQFNETLKSPLDFYLSFVEENDYNYGTYGNIWDIKNSLIIKLPIEIQQKLIEEYFKDSSFDINFDFTRVIYYWLNYFNKISKLESIKLVTLKETINHLMDTMVSKFTRSKLLSLVFLKYDIKEICLRNYYDSHQIDNLLVGLMFSDIDVWGAKKIIDKITKNGVHFEESFDVLDWIFVKYESYGVKTNKIFGSIVDIVKMDLD